MKNKKSFLDFLKNNWGMFSFWLPIWLYIIVVSLIYSARFLERGFSAFFVDFLETLVFVIFLFILFIFLKSDKKYFKKIKKLFILLFFGFFQLVYLI